jgi:hypothetical protein
LAPTGRIPQHVERPGANDRLETRLDAQPLARSEHVPFDDAVTDTKDDPDIPRALPFLDPREALDLAGGKSDLVEFPVARMMVDATQLLMTHLNFLNAWRARK